jgi:hypothetical protein
MRLVLKEEPREWRKAALLSALGLSVGSSLARWKHVIPAWLWLALLAVLAIVAILACARPRWFRGYYRFSSRLGFEIAQFAGRIVLGLFFFLIVTPVGLALRVAGKDPLRLKRPGPSETGWVDCRENTPLDRMF